MRAQPTWPSPSAWGARAINGPRPLRGPRRTQPAPRSLTTRLAARVLPQRHLHRRWGGRSPVRDGHGDRHPSFPTIAMERYLALRKNCSTLSPICRDSFVSAPLSLRSGVSNIACVACTTEIKAFKFCLAWGEYA